MYFKETLMEITKDIRYVGVNDHQVDLFEGQYVVKNGMSYNSYIILDEKTAVLDTIDQHFTDEWLGNIAAVLGDKTPDYLVIHHMEPDHSASIDDFMKKYPGTVIVSSDKAFKMMKGYFGTDYADRQLVVKDGGTLELGRHTLTFVAAPNVHWPEVMVSYDSCDKVLFSADAFGKFGALDVDEPWIDEARRYYIGIVGKFGKFAQKLLAKAAGLDIQIICALHGPILKENLSYYIGLYDAWSSYRPEAEGVVVAYTSVYGHTRKAALMLADKLRAKGKEVAVYDLARDDNSQAMADVYRYSKVVFATTTYNGGYFPAMRNFIDTLAEHAFQNRTVGFIENGSWGPVAAKNMKKALEGCTGLTLLDQVVTLRGGLSAQNEAEMDALVEALL